MGQIVNVNFKLDSDIKKSMEEACAEMGLSMSAAFVIYAKKVGRERRIPFEITAAWREIFTIHRQKHSCCQELTKHCSKSKTDIIRMR